MVFGTARLLGEVLNPDTALQLETGHSWPERVGDGRRTCGDAALRAHRRITRRTIEFIHQFLGREALFAPDGLAVAVALEPGIVRKAEPHYVQVELAGHHTRGQTAVDWFDRSGREPNVNLVLEMDAKRVWELMLAAVQ